MSQTRKPSKPLAGQSRRSLGLGDSDPRSYRAAQAFAGDSYIDNDTIRKDSAGRLFAHHALNTDETGTTEPATTESKLSAIALGLFFGGA